MKKKKQASEEYTGPRCPKCRAPVPAGASRCTRCNSLLVLDPDTGQVCDKLTDADMVELVDASRRARTKGIVKTVSNEIGKRLAMQFRKDGKLLLCISGLNLFEVKEPGSVAELQKQIEGEMDFLGKILETLEVPTQEQLEAKRR